MWGLSEQSFKSKNLIGSNLTHMQSTNGYTCDYIFVIFGCRRNESSKAIFDTSTGCKNEKKLIILFIWYD